MSEAEYAAFWLEAVARRHNHLITVHAVDGQPAQPGLPAG